MVRVTEKGFVIEVRSTSPYEDLALMTNGLVLLLMDSEGNFTRGNDPKPHVLRLLGDMLPSEKQFESGLKAV